VKKLFAKHQNIWSQKSFCLSVLAGVVLFAGSLALNFVANNYATEVSSNPVTDLLLDNLPLVNTEIIFVEGTLLFIVFVFLLLIHEPRRIPYVLKSVALFVIVRSVFITFTHLGPFPQRVVIQSTNEIFRALVYTAGADLFFSGHTGIPFLFALMFWRKYFLRVFFLLSSVAAAVSVILGHMHYTIDVMSAYFITYAIYHLTRKFFRYDLQVFNSGLATAETSGEK